MSRPLRVGIDARPLNRSHVRGMGRYVTELVQGVSRLADVQWQAYIDRPDLPLHDPGIPSLTMTPFDWRGYRVDSWMQMGLPWHARRDAVDVLHATSTGAPWWQPRPTVVTIHDTVPWQGAGETQDGFLYQRLLPAAYRRCAAVITISESSRRDIVSLWPDLAGRLHVIPHGVGDVFHASSGNAASSPLSWPRPYFVYVGGDLPRKRLDWAFRVLERLDAPEVELVLCGIDAQARDRVLNAAPPALRPRLHVAPFLDDAEMANLFRHAVALLYPTLYEGFGFPAVESQAVGTPVLMSPLGSLKELDGPAAVMLPPEDLDAWVGACRRLLSERGEHVVPRDDARDWARQFSWEESARCHLHVYRSVAGGDIGSTARAPVSSNGHVCRT